MAATENSFDIASQISLPEISNAVQQTLKEVTTRYDLKNSHTVLELDEKEKKLVLATQDDYKLKAVTEILQQKLVKRGVSLKALTYNPIEAAAGGTVRQTITLRSGIASEKARDIVKLIKDSKKKVQASIQGETVRVAGKDRDTLQEVIALLRGHDFGIDLQFINYRSQ